MTSGLSKYRSYAHVLSCVPPSASVAPLEDSPNVRTRVELVVSRNCACAGIKGSFSPARTAEQEPGRFVKKKQLGIERKAGKRGREESSAGVAV